jgi:CubicO group peptidase (beta-lactamase class C family)
MVKGTYVRFALALMAVFCIIPASERSVALQDASLSSQVDKLFAAWDRPDSPGCALAVVKDAEIIYSRGYGMADLEHDIPVTPTSAFYVGSLSKQFTAMAIALLSQGGTLRLDDDIHKYVPELPSYGKSITIRHLIHHTSGLPEYMPLLARAGWRPDAPFSDQDALQIVARETRLNFEPGEQFAYSNTGYTLLAVIVERAARVHLDQFAEARIFAPLNMKDTHFHADATRLVKRRAYGYELLAGGGVRLAPPVPTRVGAGGIFTTVEDLARWDRNYAANHTPRDVDARQGDQYTHANKQDRLDEHKPENAPVIGADSESNGQLVTAFRHGSRDHAEQTHRGEQQRAEREGADHGRARPLLSKCVANDFLHRARITNSDTGVDISNCRPHLRHQRSGIARGAERVVEGSIAPVLGPDVDLRTAVLMNVVKPRLPHDSDDGEGTVSEERDLHSDRIAAGKETPGERGIDQRLVHVGGPRRLKRATGDQPHAHDLKVAGARRDDVG